MTTADSEALINKMVCNRYYKCYTFVLISGRQLINYNYN